MRVVRGPNGEAIALVVSRRNLRALLAKLDGQPAGSRATLISPAEDGLPWFILKAEEDAVHYADREDPGSMHHLTEAAIAAPGSMHHLTEAAIAAPGANRPYKKEGA